MTPRIDRMRTIAPVVCALAVAACGGSRQAEPPASSPTRSDVVAHVELDPLPPSVSALKLRRVRVDDPVYRTSKDYEGYDIGEVVGAVFADAIAGAADADVVFVCSDGYRATMPVTDVRDGGVLAVRDVGAPPEVRWQPLRQGREYMLPAPYYLVWPPASASGRDRPWPYRVVALELSRPAVRVETSDAAVAHGEDLFRRYCRTCHAVNLQGGALGPELNVPMNVTEYLDAAVLKRLIRDPATVRASSKMPASPQLADADVDALVSYLAFMKSRKIRLN